MSAPGAAPVLVGGAGSLVRTADGRSLADLAMGFGAAFLGHAHPAVTARVAQQAAGLWSTARNPTPARQRVDALLAALLPPGLKLGGLCNTGMEVAEFALRIAATHTGRREFAGFARSMHGKSAVTAALCWDNAPLRPGHLHTLPFVGAAGEAQVLEQLERVLRPRTIAALFVEPIQGSGDGHEASLGFYDEALALCRAHGTLCVFDEILTGFHRTGPRFYADRLRARPDLLLFAKCMGNGFPVSALALDAAIAIRPAASPGSTFAGNELALAAIEGTQEAMRGLDLERLVAAIERTVRAELAPLRERGAVLRGRGALWCVELDPRLDLAAVLERIRAADLLVTSTGRSIRLLPAATIDLPLLAESCRKIAAACTAAGA